MEKCIIFQASARKKLVVGNQRAQFYPSEHLYFIVIDQNTWGISRMQSKKKSKHVSLSYRRLNNNKILSCKIMKCSQENRGIRT